MEQKVKYKIALKASNAILLLLVLIIVVLLSAVTLAINLKFNQKDFSFVHNNKSQYDKIAIKIARVVSVSNVSNCLIVASDTMRLEASRTFGSDLQVDTTGDTVRIVAARVEKSGVERNVILYLPTGTTVSLDSSTADVRGGYDFQKRPSFSFVLNNSRLTASAPSHHTFFDKLDIEGNSTSSVEVLDRVHINNVNLANVYDAKFNEGFQIANLTTSFDASRRVSVAKTNWAVRVSLEK
ncbi:hypothetical protein [Chryseolinea lacunae]|uniref:Auto-transporter adhesin head GIN domain-containing protein n=1 Tax=Chryseolinea lacunae TaxID=2801331 RepID=A0ABS1L1E0_9BACT|nr:hypothetical protein [Chryseolinea lacunae]MBL0745531.1 hypothetical protein [Chryseolinea lacunae]